jgi:hypothetical protein
MHAVSLLQPSFERWRSQADFGEGWSLYFPGPSITLSQGSHVTQSQPPLEIVSYSSWNAQLCAHGHLAQFTPSQKSLCCIIPMSYPPIHFSLQSPNDPMNIDISYFIPRRLTFPASIISILTLLLHLLTGSITHHNRSPLLCSNLTRGPSITRRHIQRRVPLKEVPGSE